MKVITFSRVFPKKHPRAGEQTHFVEKIWKSFMDSEFGLPKEFHKYVDDYTKLLNNTRPIDLMAHYFKVEPKYHTIRAGNRWKVGDFFSPRVWSGKPYASKQIKFAPPIEIKKVWDFEFINSTFSSEHGHDQGRWFKIEDIVISDYERGVLAKNDGLNEEYFIEWFICHLKNKETFTGQIICWNENIEYA